MNSDNAAGGHALLKLWQRHPFRLHIAVLFIALVFVVGLVLVWSGYLQGRNIVLTAAEDVFGRIEREMRSEMLNLRDPVEGLVDWMSRAPITDAVTFDARMQALPALAEALNRYTMLESVYVGYYNGDFFQLHALRNDADRTRFAAPRHAAYRLQSIEHGGKIRFRLFDAALNPISDPPVPPDYRYDPRVRPWYVEALRTLDTLQTDPYVFFTTRETGQTIARRAEHGRAVVGADITLSRLAETLALVRPSPSSQLAVFDAEGRVTVHSGQPHTPPADARGNPVLVNLADISPVLAGARTTASTAATAAPGAPAESRLQIVKASGREWLTRIVPLARTAKGITYLGIATPNDELLTVAHAALQRSLWLALALVLLTVPLIWWVASRIAANLHALTGQAAAIRRFNFDDTAPIRSRVIEVNELGLAMGQMRETIRKFLDISTALAAESDLDRLLDRLVAESMALAGADAAVVYLIDDDGVLLSPSHRSWRDAHLLKEQTPLSHLHLRNDASHQVVITATTGRSSIATLHATDTDATARYFTGAIKAFGAERLGVAAIPLHNRQHEIIGVLSLGRKLDADSSEPYSPELISFIEALSGTTAVSIETRRLIKEQKDLLESFIQLVASAIDAKSPYTGGHCQRVPELTKMLAHAACDADEGPYRDFKLTDEQWEAVHIASWLHDCGKVTTPEYVVDKATKLETIWDRIHEIRTRFEVLKRDAEIEYWKAVAGGGDAAALKPALNAKCAELDAEFAFIAECNIGGEFMAPDRIERVKRIAQRSWLRTLDDRIGVSHDEKKRRDRTPAPQLPVVEPLLADKAEHVFERDTRERLAEDNPWGFKLKTPAVKYNKGEVYNLSIGRGTLTEEERFQINDHIMQTIIMLSRLPFPKHLRQIPEIAGGHHEKMDGTGYPKRLKRDQMSPVARMMAIADIFEALTAADRPYKKGKTLSESIKIMGFMKKDQHIDPELFELFLTSGVYRRYADRYMRPEQIDEVDIKPYLSTA